MVQRREGESAVAAKNGGDAVDVGRGGVRVPEELGVVVGVDIDEAGGYDEAVSVEGLGRLFIDGAAERDDPTIADTDIALDARGSGAVDDGAAADEVVEHAGCLS